MLCKVRLLVVLGLLVTLTGSTGGGLGTLSLDSSSSGSTEGWKNSGKNQGRDVSAEALTAQAKRGWAERERQETYAK
jgi:hypothetical protein